ncbi:hypothetical protein BO94DRAFT_572272 [Aspergillus sclerotioniger CBS 115572]|uniref:Developmental regulator FlbE n=1 Tax=Aspergillus sclerotioniger CBS 115572 TaxID=1450535 RepID=A0A317X978_9EURO|nr:hypothetical protein BO94DRAFT_572272 [Aspergillus sclerotioniger CBS 115572]PWY94721.1 hypothetical protein BO94DRAFT_572272 [Aspergillus sclerotioniger CBS 115572]
MPVYMLYGFRWPRAGFTGIRVYIVLHNLEDATAEYIQQPLTTSLLLSSFQKTDPDILSRLPSLRFIEQYDPEDTSDEAVSKPHAYVGAKVISIPEAGGEPLPETSWKPEDIFQESPLGEEEMQALTEFRDKYAAGERIGWWIVYNGDPERWFPVDEEGEMGLGDGDSYGEEYEGDSYGEEDDGEGREYGSDRTQTPPETPSSATVGLCFCSSWSLQMRLPERLTRLFARRTA